MTIDERIRQVDQVMDQASVNLESLSSDELAIAKQLCEYFELPFGTLVRRAEAIRLLGDTDPTVDRLREAAQHLIAR